MSRRKILSIAALASLAVVLLAVGAGILVLQSGWFHEKVRATLITTLEDATGGRAEIGSFQFNWKQMRVEAGPLVLHGNEPAGKPPLLRAASVTVGLKVISFLERKVDLQSLDVQRPDVYVIVYPDGHTNVPEPRIKRRSERTPVDTLLNLAVGRFSLQHGTFEVEGRSRTPFSARGQNLETNFTYDRAVPRYQGNLAIQPLEVQWNGLAQQPLGVRMALAIERNRITVSSARLSAGNSEITFDGAVDELAAPHAAFRYEARASAADASRILRIRGLEGGTAVLTGNAAWTGGLQYSITGNLRLQGGAFRQAAVRIANVRAEAAVRIDEQGIRLGGLRFSGDSEYNGSRLPIQGRATELTLRGEETDARGLTLDALGGSFTGDARLRAGNQFTVRGDLHNFEARRAVAVYSKAPLPWNSLVSGKIEIAGAVRQPKDLRVSADLTVAPAPQSPPVQGQIALVYDRKTGTLELGRSTLLLPASRVELSGAIGRQLRVHLETRDLNDFLAALGESFAQIPVKLENGTAVFDGAVTGESEEPRVAGRLTVSNIAYAGKRIDSLRADVNAAPTEVRLQNATAAVGAGRAQFQFSAGLQDWKPADSSMIFGSGTVRDAMLAELLGLFNQKDLSLTGTLGASAQISGTVGNPQWSADIQVVKGSIRSEPFDRLSGRLAGTAREVTWSSGQASAGARQVNFTGSFDHPANRFDSGQVRFQIQSNALALAEIRTLAQSRPGLQGTVQVSATGAMDVNAGKFRLTALQGDLTGRGLRLNGQQLGDVRLTASSQGPVLKAHLDSTFDQSAIHGDGEWRMEGDYPGNASITFNSLDLAGLRSWIAPAPSRTPPPFTGFAQGTLRIDGPALKPEMLRAELTLPSLEIRPAAAPAGLVLRNSGPIVARAANSVITIEKADLVARATNVTVSGTIAYTQRNPLDLRAKGQINLGLLKTYNPDIDSSGAVMLDASVRGPLASPQVNGQLQMNDGAFSYGMLPNGISNANGTILFTGDRATIQKLEATTGGGTVQLSGFTGYGPAGLLFGLHAVTHQVRIRYPEGVSTVSDATLDLSGSPDRSMLTGTVTIERATVNLQSDFGSLLAKSAEPVRIPATRTGILAGLNYDIQIETAPDIEIESALTEGIEADASLRLRGTATAPALLGRVRITQGQLVFFGTKYTINQGSVSFFNPLKIDPILDIDLETKARGIDITITVAGPLNKLTMTPRSDPPLQYNEIISVLTTGEAPTAEMTRFGQAVAPQTSQQTAATALLGQVIANPVSGRLQRFFGISRLRINPTLDPALASGVQYTPQARLTLEQQVTPDITFTYITDLSNANAQIVSVEWAVNKQWSVVAQREENGLVGLDFFWKKRFK